MNVPKAWIKILCLVSLFALTYANIDSKEFFCGKKLVRTLSELCSIYNNPTFARHRFRRQIVDECCRSQCSRRYLVQYYCQEANNSVAHLLKAAPKNASEAPLRTKEPVPAPPKPRMPVGSPEDPETNNAFLAIDLASTHERKFHRKRNCKCRKRRAKVL
uniref:Insulin-like peptide 3 n=1 Tax=Gnatocerus cornutus TaxID=1553328 RepID=A0A7G1GD27_9CUCU|nr:insulin-like peptide 3 [Gnatocerus cornutus]